MDILLPRLECNWGRDERRCKQSAVIKITSRSIPIACHVADMVCKQLWVTTFVGHKILLEKGTQRKGMQLHRQQIRIRDGMRNEKGAKEPTARLGAAGRLRRNSARGSQNRGQEATTMQRNIT